MAVQSFGADSEDVQTYSFRSWKGKVGDKIRVGFVYPESGAGGMFAGAQSHYIDGAGYVQCKSTTDKKAICCTHNYENKRPRWRVGVVMVMYTIQDKKLKGYTLKPWIFTDKMYAKLKTTNEEFPLTKHDVILSCTNEDYQTIEPQPCKESYWQAKESLARKIREEADAIMEDIKSNVVRELTVEEIKEKLGIDDIGAADAAADVDLGDVLDDI